MYRYFAADTVWTEMDGNTNGKQFGMILLSILVTIAISFVVGALNGRFRSDKMDKFSLIAKLVY